MHVAVAFVADSVGFVVVVGSADAVDFVVAVGDAAVAEDAKRVAAVAFYFVCVVEVRVFQL